MNLTYVEIKPVQNNKYKLANVFYVLDDMVFLKGEIFKRIDGGVYLQSANSTWKDQTGKTKNNFIAGILDESVKTKLDSYIISLYTSNTFEFKSDKLANVTVYKNRFNKTSATSTTTSSSPTNGIAF
jgi:DNA gyrase inhibitor GyrI